MNPVARNVLAVVGGLVIGSVVNMGIVMMSKYIIPPPVDVDTSDINSIREKMHLYTTAHFIPPFLAHALGTFAGALIAALVAVSRKMTFALVIGGFFLLGGIAAVVQLPSPMWFNVLDLAVAYIPMAWLGGTIAIRRSQP